MWSAPETVPSMRTGGAVGGGGAIAGGARLPDGEELRDDEQQRADDARVTPSDIWGPRCAIGFAIIVAVWDSEFRT